MNKVLQHDLDAIDQLLEKALGEGLSYLNNLDNIPTSVEEPHTSGGGLSCVGSGSLHALQEFKRRFADIMVASSGPRYLGFVTGGVTPAALIGDMLVSMYDQNTQKLSGHGDISARIELETIQMLLDLFELPASFIGGFVTGATMSNFTCLAVARQWLGCKHNHNIAKEGVAGKLKIIASTPHSSILKSLSMLGLGRQSITYVNPLEGDREAMDIDKLEECIKSLNGEPFILISSGGTVNSVDYDDMKAIAALKSTYDFWWHVDAAFGGFAVLSDEHKHLLNGWEEADSITVDAHKWLNVPYESAFFFVKECYRHRQIETFQNADAPYLGEDKEHFNYLNLLPENSRRFKALPAWFTLKAYGRKGYEDIISNNIRLARHLGQFIDGSEFFELLAPVRLNTVCFTLRDGHDPYRVEAFVDELNKGGKVFMTPTVFKGRHGVRAAFVNWRTTDIDLRIIEDEMLIACNKISVVWF